MGWMGVLGVVAEVRGLPGGHHEVGALVAEGLAAAARPETGLAVHRAAGPVAAPAVGGVAVLVEEARVGVAAAEAGGTRAVAPVVEAARMPAVVRAVAPAEEVAAAGATTRSLLLVSQ